MTVDELIAQLPEAPSSPFKGDGRGSSSSPFKGDGRGSSSSPSKGDRRGYFAWQVADVIDYELLKANAKKNRENMTEAESAFWQIARSNGLGQKCRRQYIIGQYIVDFFFRESKLIVELDGEYHFTDEQKIEDAIRQGNLESMGYRLLRFTNVELLSDTENVIKKVKDNLIF